MQGMGRKGYDERKRDSDQWSMGNAQPLVVAFVASPLLAKGWQAQRA